MNYIQLINRFWAKDLEYAFNSLEIALYMRLLDRCNRLGWKNPFHLSVERLMAHMALSSKKPFDTARKRLRDADLLRYTNGNGRGSTTEYTIIGVGPDSDSSPNGSNGGAPNAPLSGVVSAQIEDGFGAFSGLVHKTKPDETKPDQNKKNEAHASAASNDSSFSPTGRWRAEKKKEDLDSFEKFWNAYGKKVDRALCLKRWNALTDADRSAILANVPTYVRNKPDKQFLKNPANYLAGRCWLDEITPSPSHRGTSNGPSAAQIQRMMDSPPSPFITFSKADMERMMRNM
ncbi:hypothetical protein [Hymenobacter convexus]|uniref:hypothetical protein n=1 Tax=Hymenobacter sp. CA1UV-4 TaxID=3063782 RepID=UPI00271327D3|nr:hypothetical protein [Hymenobacter sp. CA1UV-4]MDO7850405.1 hypothetical protein [Hymenobacter sp. CA1UV-4]